MTTTKNALDYPTVFVVYVRTKKRAVIRRIDAVYGDFASAHKRITTMKLADDEMANISAQAIRMIST